MIQYECRRMAWVAVVASALAASAASAADWSQYADPVEAGFDVEKLARVRKHAEPAGSAAVFVVFRDHVLVALGEVDRPFELASTRKSLVSGMVGLHVPGKIDLKRTLAEMNIDDEPPLTEQEKQATLGDLLKSRSGVYHAAAKEPGDMKRGRPARGSHAPGEHWWYNNWDFNTIGAIVEKTAGRALYLEFDERFAKPLGMEDYRVADQFAELEPSHSTHPAHAFRLSARDLARFGQLYLRKGQWDGRTLISAEWIAESTTAHSRVGDDAGYGYMWWVYPAGGFAQHPHLSELNAVDKFAAKGNGGQVLLVIPVRDIVFVHLADTDNGDRVEGARIWSMAEAVLRARVGPPIDAPRLVELAPVAFKRPSKPPRGRSATDLATIDPSKLVGEYESTAGPGKRLKLFMHQGRMFGNNMKGFETELLAESRLKLFSRAEDVQISLERNDQGDVLSGVVTIEGESTPVRRLPQAPQ